MKNIEEAKSKKKIEARQVEPDEADKHIKYRDFVHKEWTSFSMADVQRSIPSVVDGLTSGQRKILFCSFKMNFVKEEALAGFCGYVLQHSAYHHGYKRLSRAIIGMAQDYVGSNNINLLLPNGQFGTRAQGGKNHASPWVLYTQLSPVTRFLFPKVDDILLKYLSEDGQSIEPIWYAPIIPMVLVNGCERAGIGWSSSVPNYNPFDIIANIRRLLNDEPTMVAMHPWYKGFIGSIEKNTTGDSYTVSGNIEEVDEKSFKITELPIRMWTEDYEEFLRSVSVDNDKSLDPFVQEFFNWSGLGIVNFSVCMSEERLPAVKKEGLLKKLKLTTCVGTDNMHLFDPRGVIKKYETPEQILEEFFHVRLEIYKKRKEVVLANLEEELLKCENKCRLIQCVTEGSIPLVFRDSADRLLELKAKGFTPFLKKENFSQVAVAGLSNEDKESVENSSDYDYLLSLPIRAFTPAKAKELFAEREKLAREVEDLKQATVKSLWMRDLDALEGKLIEESNNFEKRRAHRKWIQDRNTRTGIEVGEIKKPRGEAAAQKKAQVTVTTDEDDDDIADLRQRMAAYDRHSSPDCSEEMPTKKQPNERGAAKKPSSNVSEMDDDDVETIIDGDFELEEKKKKGGSILGRSIDIDDEEVDASKSGSDEVCLCYK